MTSIADYALLGDCQGAALVAVDGSVDWWCPGRFDAPSVFARLLDPEAGHWLIRPRQEWTATRHYVEGSMVVQTDFTTAGGVLRLTDALALGPGERRHQIGYASPHLLVRQVEVVRGEVEIDIEMAPRQVTTDSLDRRTIRSSLLPSSLLIGRTCTRCTISHLLWGRQDQTKTGSAAYASRRTPTPRTFTAVALGTADRRTGRTTLQDERRARTWESFPHHRVGLRDRAGHRHRVRARRR